MCMKISKEHLFRINRGFGGTLRSDFNLNYAIQTQNNSKLGEYKKLAYLWRAILVDPPFSDGNKKTAVFFAISFADENNKVVNRDLLVHHAVSIARNNITNIRQIEWRLKTCIY